MLTVVVVVVVLFSVNAPGLIKQINNATNKRCERLHKVMLNPVQEFVLARYPSNLDACYGERLFIT